MSQFLSEAKQYIHNFNAEKQYVIDVLLNKSFVIYLIKGKSVVEQWSKEIKVNYPVKNQLLSVYEVITDMTKFNPDDLGVRIYLDQHKYHYIYRGNMEVDMSERLYEYHVERCTDLRRIWVKKNSVKSWCKLIYSHCWDYEEERVELYHVFEENFYREMDVSKERKKLLGHLGFKYNIGEFVKLTKDTPNPDIGNQVKTVVANLTRSTSTQTQATEHNQVKTVFADLKRSTNMVVKEKVIVLKALQNPITEKVINDVKPDQPTESFKEKDVIAALENNLFKFKDIIPHICNDEELMTRLISTLTMEDPLSVNDIMQQHKKNSVITSSENVIAERVAKALMKRDIDLIKIFFSLFDSGNLVLCKQIVTNIGLFEPFKSQICLEKQKISIEDQYNHINKIFTDCIRLVLSVEERPVDDENSRVRKFRELFKLSDVQNIINDRNDRAHSYIKQERIPRALKDRIQCLEEAKSAHKKQSKKSLEKNQYVGKLIQNAIEELGTLQVKFNQHYCQ